MSFEDPDIGPVVAVVFVGLQHDELGVELACFVTNDGASFVLDAAMLEMRIRALNGRGCEVAEERRALRSMTPV